MSVFIISNVKSSTQQNVSVIKMLIQNTKITLKNIFQSGQNITDKSQKKYSVGLSKDRSSLGHLADNLQ
jgi:hypothetical protein